MAQIRGVITDIDGTLVDSNDAHAHAWVRALAEHGYQVPFERVRPLIGMGSDKLLPAVIGVEADSPEGKQLSERRAAIFKADYLPTLRPFPGARALLQHMRAQGLKLVVATSANEDEMHPLLEIAGVADLMDEKTSAKETKETKPDPDVVQIALDKLDLAPDEAVMLGDTRYDVEAARRAGTGTIALRCGGADDEVLAGAIAIYDDPADLLAHYAESPLGPDHAMAE